MEEWRTIDEAPTYLISNYGRVQNGQTGRILKPSLNHGYPTVTLVNGRQSFSRRIHRLVAIAFVNGQENGPWVNHIDGDKQNAHYTNLEWVTQEQNREHAMQTGLIRKLRSWDEKGKLIEEPRKYYRAFRTKKEGT